MLIFAKVWQEAIMNISLTPKLEDFIKAKVKSGDYNNASEVIREALRGMQERDVERKAQLGALRRLIRDGEESGQPIPWDPEAIKREVRRRAHKR
jgi:antitoxin ParD1/3/4